jgi:hypothetical protein
MANSSASSPPISRKPITNREIVGAAIAIPRHFHKEFFIREPIVILKKY